MKSFRKSKASLFWAAASTVASFGIIGRPLPAWGATATNTSGPVLQGTSDGSNNYSENNPAITISFSGQTALRSFDTSAAITELQPGTSITLHDGTDGAPVTYTATNDDFTNVQLANPNFSSPDIWEDSNGDTFAPGTETDGTVQDIQVNSAINLEWHEQGSIDGFYDLINDEVGYAQNSAQAAANGSAVGPISNEALRTPSSSNPTWINTNKFTLGGVTINGFSLDNSADDILDETYNTNVYTQATGVNILGGQNRIQFSVGEFPTEAVSVAGTPSPFAAPGASGYGLGNPALAAASTLTGLGVGGVRQQYQPASILNESTAIDDPQTGTNYASGPWNTAGTNNITSTPIAATAVTYSANPGTGLYRIDLGDAQWLQTTGRLQNGALFNVVARTVDTGQRVVFAANTGIDPSWAVGSNDDGNSTSTAAANAQHSIGASLRFDGKTSGTEAEKTIAQSRMSLGALSVPEARAAASNAPVRALDVDFTDQTDVNPADDATNFIRADFNTIVSSASNRYQAVLISHYNTVKSPNETALNNELTALGINPASATAQQQQTAWGLVQSFNPADLSDPTTSGIKGDPTGDVGAFIANIANSVATAATGVNSPSSANDPADGLLSIGFLLPDLLDWTRATDGGAITPVTLSPTALGEQEQAQSNYGPLFGTDNSAASNVQTIGSSSTYGDGNSGGATINGSIPITAKSVTWVNGTATNVSAASNGAIVAGGNYLFGNFNQNGVRDLSSVEQAVNAALSLYAVDGAANSMFSGVANSTVVPSLVGNPGWKQTGTNTKGDLIALGDYNGDGSFNGEDLYLLAIGASLADNTTSGTLTATAATFSDAVRNPADVLRKNYALNYINNYLSTTNDTTGALFLRQTGRAVLLVPGTSANVPFGATDLGADPVAASTEDITFDPNGVNAFNPNDVDRDGLVDFNDAVLVDQYYGQSYENLSESLAATEPTPVTGVTEAVSLVDVQQVDGEAAIGAADLAIENQGLAETGNANWYGYAITKTGPGTIIWGRTAGTVTVYTGATFGISAGAVQVGGTVDPFSDNNLTGPTVGNHVALTVSNGGELQLNQTGRTITVSGLTVDLPTSGLVDVGSTNLAIDYTPGKDPVANIVSYLTSGYKNGTWTGTAGIVSSVAAAAGGSIPLLAVGYGDGNVDTGLGNSTLTAAAPNQVLVKFTLAGDALLNGTVDFNDLDVVGKHLNTSGNDWANGNFNYDGNGATNFNDLDIVGQNLNKSLASVEAELPALTVLPLAANVAVTTNNTIVTPEPTSIALVAVGAAGLLSRRRRRDDRVNG
jgi:hypothetical protein